MEALALLNEGRLDDAVASAAGHVRDNPRATGAREILAELYCVRGEMERADRQLETALQQDPGASLNFALLRQLIRAETARREFWMQGRLPEFLGGPDPSLQSYLLAHVSLLAGRADEAAEAIARAEDGRQPVAGVCDGAAFSDFRDLDDLCAGVIEVLTSTGKYYWIPPARIQSMEFEPVARPRDLLWRQCQMSVLDGPDGVVYVPAIYPTGLEQATAAIRLGRETAWTDEAAGPVRGIGQRVFAADDRELAIMEIGSLSFQAVE